MAWLEGKGVAAGLGALLLLGTACSSDSPSNGGAGESGSDETSDNGLDGTGESDPPSADAGNRMDASIVRPDAALTPPASDAGDAGVPVIKLPDGAILGGGGSVKDGGATDAPIDTKALTPLPHDGSRGSICYGDGDCNGADLRCQLPPGTAIPGFCVDDCAADTDCKAIDGVEGVCNPPLVGGLCTYPCGGPQNDGKGECPSDMVCANFATGATAALFPDFRCRYPEGGGKRTEKAWGQCDPSHLNGDCEGLNVCHQPALSLASAALPHGYCVNVCASNDDCRGPESNTSEPICWFGACELNCGIPGGNCPTGMNCMDIDPTLAVATMRCIFID